ncbi:hypothetical protein AB1K91_17690 [Terribacillus sp. 179-K 1B1 HS]|uniref:hypothetical protein n=1 Tax=Terribacillus sp. 179-K 1B1 HS TaxID=3142388 RepID=UPI0039A08021
MAKVIKFTGEYVNAMVGKVVVRIDGPGQSIEFPSESGKIVGETSGIWGDFWAIEWDNGHQEPCAKSGVKPAAELNGIGVYYV